MRKGPYLIYSGNESRMKILWQLENSAECRLRWGGTEHYELGDVATWERNPGPDGHQHIYTVKGLEPGRKCYYQVVENGVEHCGSFLAAPCGNAETVTFFAYGDTRTLPERHDSVLSAVRGEIIKDPLSQTFMLHAGDWNTSDEELCWDMEFFNRGHAGLLELPSIIAFQGARGNHEHSAVNYNKYWPYAYEEGGSYYSFDYGPVHVSVLDQYSDFFEGSDQLRWLEKDLATSGKAWKITLLHEPGFTDESAHGNRPDVQELIHPLCTAYGVRFVIGGHNHLYARCMVDGVCHLTLGGGGGPLYEAHHRGTGLVMSESCLHFAKIRAEPDSAACTIVRADGSILERFAIERPAETPDAPVEEAGELVHMMHSSKKLELDAAGCGPLRLEVLDAMGRTVISRQLQGPNRTVCVASLRSGVYLVRAWREGLVKHERIVLR
jgi:hypothetical protein